MINSPNCFCLCRTSREVALLKIIFYGFFRSRTLSPSAHIRVRYLVLEYCKSNGFDLNFLLPSMFVSVVFFLQSVCRNPKKALKQLECRAIYKLSNSKLRNHSL